MHIYRNFLESIGFINREKVGINIVNDEYNSQIITKNLGERCLDMNGDGKKK